MLNNFASMLRDEDGQGLVEYALIIALVSVVCVLILGNIGKDANTKLTAADAGLK